MKKKIAFLPLLLILPLGSSFLLNQHNVNEVSAAFPTTGIDAEDETANQVRSYYSSLSSGLTGSNLVSGIRNIIKNGHTALSSNARVWNAYKIVNRDWTQSPLTSSELSSYAKYDNDSDNPYIRNLYRDDNFTSTAAHANDTHGTYIDREHVWAKSHGNFEWSAPAGIDLHHLMPGDSVNNQQAHNNLDYGNVDKTRSYSQYGSDANHNRTCYRGYAVGKDSSNEVFEPYDEDKGDIARALFYMATRYASYGGSTGDPYLQLIDGISGTSTVTSTSTTPGQMGILSTLLEWHKQDPVDDFEVHRNNLIYNNYQGNRNPFIDFPSWAEKCFGSDTVAANPSTDAVRVMGGGTPTITGCEFDFTSAIKEYEVGESFDTTGITAKLVYSDESKVDVPLSSLTFSPYSSGDVFTDSDVGEHTITASYLTYSDTYSIEVSAKAPEYVFRKRAILENGDFIAITEMSNSKELTSVNTGYKYGVGSSYSTVPSGSFLFEVGKVSGIDAYTLKASSGYLSSSGTSNFEIKDIAASSLTENNYFTVSFDKSFKATISRYSDSSTKLYWNNSYTRFNFYSGDKSASTYFLPTLWKRFAIDTPEDTFELSSTSLNIMKGGSAQISCSSSSGPSNFAYFSDDNTIATVSSSGLVNAIKEGETVITAIKGTLVKTISVTITSSTLTAYHFEKVTSYLSDYSGRYLIGYEPESGNPYFMNGASTTLGSTFNNVRLAKSANGVAYCASSLSSSFVIEKISGGYSIKSDSGYYIGKDGNSSNGVETSTSSALVNTISITDGTATIRGAGGNYLRFNSASNGLCFRYYKSSSYTSQKAIYLYKLSGVKSEIEDDGTISSFDTAFMNAFSSICKSDDTTNISDLTQAWLNQKAAYLELSPSAQAIFMNSSALSSTRLYDYIYGKYAGSISGIKDFALRNPSSSLLLSDKKATKESVSPVAYVAVILALPLALASLLVVRKLKKR